jgi:uncharacterized protein (DUF1697 family)
MKTYIALLRGINVSGQKKIKMSDLKSLFENLGFKDIRTYIQSGNVIFKSSASAVKKLELKIETAIKNYFGFDVPVLIITPTELEKVIKQNSFLKKKKDTGKMYVTFLADVPSKENVSKFKKVDFSPEEYSINGKNIYLFFPNGYGRAKINNTFFENKLKVLATTRNWKTINKLFEIAASM